MKKKRRILWKRVFLYFLIIFLVVGSMYVYLRTGFFTIRNYDLIGVDNKYQQTFQKKFAELSKQKIYLLLPGNRIISYHSADIKSYIREILPDTASISIYPISLHTLKITVTPYKPLFRLENKYAVTKDAIVYK